MREETLFRAIGDVGDDLIARADEPVQKKKPVRWAGIAALAACCLIAVGLARLVTMSMGNTSDSTAALDAAAPETPMMQATEEAKSGSAESRFSVLTESGLNHVTEYEGGVLGAQCSELLKNYFKAKRKAK